MISTRTLRVFIPNESARHAVSSPENSDQKTLFWTSKRCFFCGQVNVNKAALVWEKKARGRHSNQEKKQLTAKAAWIVFSEVLGELILIRDNSCHVHVKNSDKMVETISFHRRIFGRYLRRGVFYESHRKRIEFYLKKKSKTKQKDKKTTRKQQEKCVYVQNNAGCEDGDDIPVQFSRQACFVNSFTPQGFNERIFMWLLCMY